MADLRRWHEANDPKIQWPLRRELAASLERPVLYLQILKKFLCVDGTIEFAQCSAGAGDEGSKLTEELQNVFGPKVKVQLYCNPVYYTPLGNLREHKCDDGKCLK
jgi:hypothetical protein